MPATVIDSVSTQLEQVADMVAKYYDHTTELSSKLKINKTVAASRLLYRQPVQKWVGGTHQKYSANRGDMGSGSGPNYSDLKAGFFDSTLNYEVTKEQMDYMKSNGSAMVDVLSDIMDGAMKQLDVFDNIYLFGDGTGKLTASASSSPGGTQLIFAGGSDYLGVSRLVEGMFVDVWDTTGATKRAGGPYQIINIDSSTKTVTFGASVTGIAGTDLLAIVGADAYGPATLVSFTSTWPGGGTTNGPGLTGDSWRHGLGYANDATGANYYLTRQKSSFSQLMPTQVAAAGAALTFSMVEQAKNLMLQRRDNTILDGLTIVMHYAQREQLRDSVTAISEFQRTSASASMPDMQPTVGDVFTVAGIPACCDKRADKSRVDAFNAKNWFRVEGHETKWLDYGDGQKIKLVQSASTGNPLAAYELKLVQKMDTGCMDPGASFFISGLAVPSGY